MGISARAEGQHDIEFVANPTQRLFIENVPDIYDPRDKDTWGHQAIDCFSCRMGEGKSTALVWSIYYHTLHNPGAKWLVVRDTWENCRDTTLQEFFKWFPDGVCCSWKASEKSATWTLPQMGGGSIRFIGLDDEQDAGKLQSREYAGVAIDEPSPASGSAGIDRMVFTTALTRLRQPGMKWYAAKLAQNNPDESHWTYELFVEPGTPGYQHFQTATAENIKHLPPDYYENMAVSFSDRPDLMRRFSKGEFGYQQEGRPVTPNWSDSIHLAESLSPVENVDLVLLWDFGLDATCIITQPTPMGYWNILESFVENGSGTYQLITDVVKPAMEARYKGFAMWHTGDPNGEMREQSNSSQSAVKVLRNELGGRWRKAPADIKSRTNPINTALSRQINGTGMIQVDKRRAKEVHHALRGGWHYKKHQGGTFSPNPAKNKHSHPGDAIGYGAAVLFPNGAVSVKRAKRGFLPPGMASHFSKKTFLGRPGVQMPAEGQEIP